jgi:hypothetical protein
MGGRRRELGVQRCDVPLQFVKVVDVFLRDSELGELSVDL